MSSMSSQRSHSEPSITTTPTLLDILRSKELKKTFEQWGRMNHCPENLCFYCAVEEYKLLEEGEEGGMKERAQEIYEKFLTQEVEYEICAPHDVRQNLLANLTNPNRETFDELQGFVFMFMRSEEYKKFLESPLYFKAMGISQPDTLREVQSDPEDDDNTRRKKRRRPFFACGKVEE